MAPCTFPQVSSMGRVRSSSGRVYTPRPVDPGGYCRVAFRGRFWRLHRLVAFSFLPDPGPKRDVMKVVHIDGDKSNNRADNLRWAEVTDDMKSGRKKKSKPVIARRVGEVAWSLRFASIEAAAAELGLHRQNIGSCCNSRIRSSGGYQFRFPAKRAPEETWRPLGLGTGAWVSSLGGFRTDAAGVEQEFAEDGSSSFRVENVRYSMASAVALAFELPRKLGETEIHHIDGDVSNNRVENLRWVSPNGFNYTFGVDARPVGAAEWMTYKSAADAASNLGIKRWSVDACLRGDLRAACGFEFKRCVEAPDLEGEVWVDVPAGA